jgi:hypothetical protein
LLLRPSQTSERMPESLARAASFEQTVRLREAVFKMTRPSGGG